MTAWELFYVLVGYSAVMVVIAAAATALAWWLRDRW